MGCNTPTVEKLNVAEVQHQEFLKGKLLMSNDKLIINFLSGYMIFSDQIELVWTSTYMVGAKNPIGYDEGVILQSADDILAFNTRLSEISWEGHLSGVHPSALYLKENEVQVMGFKEKKTQLITFDLKTGEIVDEIPFNQLAVDDMFTCVGVGEKLVLFLSRKQNILLAYSKDNTKKLVWKINFDSKHYDEDTFLLTEKNLFFTVEDILYCLDLASGNIVNQYQVKSTITKAETYGDNLFLFTPFSILSLNIQNLEMRYKIESPDISDPAIDLVHNNITFFSNNAFQIYNSGNGDLIEEVELKVINATNAVFYEDAYLFVSQEGEWIKVSL